MSLALRLTVAVTLFVSGLHPMLWQAETPAAKNQTTLATEAPASPELERLAKLLVGDWDSVETMERSEFFPNAGSRHGKVHVRLAAGGSALIYEVHSDGSAGELDGFHVIWWDRGAKLYYFFACFNDPEHPCRPRGTAHWESSALVNDYEEMAGGKKTQWRDTFVFTPTSHTLTAAMTTGNGSWRTFITTQATRRR